MPEGAGLSAGSGVSGLRDVPELSGDGSGAGSSKAGRAWCQGASELRGGRGALLGRLSPGAADAARRLAEPSEALRARRGSAEPAGVPGSVADDPGPGSGDSGSLAGGCEPGAVAAGSASVAWDSGPEVGDSGPLGAWLTEPSAAVRVRRVAAWAAVPASPAAA
ncbi:hypothetical protein [Streptomyces chartreusis]|uniref:hypothetical protein n=1 Tax=Streptomyces chartreusis TaxID=1969 RepID=UPI0033A55C88